MDLMKKLRLEKCEEKGQSNFFSKNTKQFSNWYFY